VRTLAVGYFTPNVLLDLCRSTGRLRQHGVQVTEVRVASSLEQFRSLVEGRLDVALTNPDNVLGYRYDPQNGLGKLSDVKIVAAIDRGMGLGLYVPAGLGPADLVGARVGVDVATSGFALVLYSLLESLGITRDQYEVVAMGSTPRRLEALLSGECEATMLNGGIELVAEQRGCVRLVSAAQQLAPYLGGVVAVSGDSQLEGARQLSRALLDTVDDILSGGLDDLAAESAMRLLGLDAGSAARYVERLRDPVEGLVPGGQVPPEALAALVRLRTTHLPRPGADGRDLLQAALDEAAGLVVNV